MNHYAYDLHKRHRRLVRTAQSGSRRQIMKAFEEILEDYLHADLDAAHSNAILEGSWPGAVNILERALERARKIEAEDAQKEAAEKAAWEEKRKQQQAAAEKADKEAIERAIDRGLIVRSHEDHESGN